MFSEREKTSISTSKQPSYSHLDSFLFFVSPHFQFIYTGWWFFHKSNDYLFPLYFYLISSLNRNLHPHHFYSIDIVEKFIMVLHCTHFPSLLPMTPFKEESQIFFSLTKLYVFINSVIFRAQRRNFQKLFFNKILQPLKLIY